MTPEEKRKLKELISELEKEVIYKCKSQVAYVGFAPKYRIGDIKRQINVIIDGIEETTSAETKS